MESYVWVCFIFALHFFRVLLVSSSIHLPPDARNDQNEAYIHIDREWERFGQALWFVGWFVFCLLVGVWSGLVWCFKISILSFPPPPFSPFSFFYLLQLILLFCSAPFFPPLLCPIPYTHNRVNECLCY